MSVKFNVILVISVMLLLTCSVVSAAEKKVDQPHMANAVEQLEKARMELETAAKNKGGHREKAIALVNQAIAQVKQGMQYARENAKTK
jgi:competence protein ComGC